MLSYLMYQYFALFTVNGLTIIIASNWVHKVYVRLVKKFIRCIMGTGTAIFEQVITNNTVAEGDGLVIGARSF